MVDTLDGRDQIVIPAGTNSDSIIRLSRKGSCKLGNKSYRGDHLVHIQVNLLFPTLKFEKKIYTFMFKHFSNCHVAF